MPDLAARLNAALENRYRIVGELGEGGMATVFLAEDLRHARQVALKVLKPELAAILGAERFLSEIRTTANLRHPHILPLFDSGEADSFLFYLMPYVDGESLRGRLDREKQLPVNEAVRIATEVADALDHAHRHGIVHRDVKPENILLQDGRAVVSDFGIALAVGRAGGSRLTDTGVSMGTPQYMSPEQAAGDRNVGPATDVYALGCVLYEMLAGEPPHSGRTPQAILSRILLEKPDPVTRHRTSVPIHVDAAIRRALEKVPADRFPGAHDFAAALADPTFRHALDPDSAAVVAGPQAASRWRLSALIGWATVGALALGIGAWAMFGTPSAARTTSDNVTRHVLALDGWAGPNVSFGQLAAVAPDGSTMIVPTRTPDGVLQLGLKRRGSTEIMPIPGTTGAQDVAFSPDGQAIIYARGSNLVRTALSDGAAVTLAEDVHALGAAIAWLDDDSILYEQVPGSLAFMAPAKIVRLPASGGAPLQVFESARAGLSYPIWMTALPNARGVLVVGCSVAVTCTAEGARLYAIDIATGSTELVLDRVMRAWYIERTGQLVFVRPDGAVFATSFDLATLRPRGGAIPLFEGVRVGFNFVDMVIGPDGTVLYVEGPSTSFGLSRLVWVDRTGREDQIASGVPAGMTTLVLAPDDRRVAVTIEAVESSGLWIRELPDGPLTQVSRHAGGARWPAWSPDGSTVSYISSTGGTPHVRRVQATGGAGGESEVLLQRRLPVIEAVFAQARGGMIFVEDSPEHGAMLGFLDLGTGVVTEEPRGTGLNERYLALSPDGRWLAFVSGVSGRGQLYVRRDPDTGGRTQISINGGTSPVWAHNGREIFYREPATGDMIVATYVTEPDFRVQSRTRLFDARPYVSQWGQRTFDVTSDDQRFAMLRILPREGRLILIENWFDELQGMAHR